MAAMVTGIIKKTQTTDEMQGLPLLQIHRAPNRPGDDMEAFYSLIDSSLPAELEQDSSPTVYTSEFALRPSLRGRSWAELCEDEDDSLPGFFYYAGAELVEQSISVSKDNDADSTCPPHSECDSSAAGSRGDSGDNSDPAKPQCQQLNEFDSTSEGDRADVPQHGQLGEGNSSPASMGQGQTLQPEDWSPGSQLHESGLCYPCIFFARAKANGFGECTRGFDCQYCHFEHSRAQNHLRRRRPRASPGKAKQTTNGSDNSYGGDMMLEQQAQQTAALPVPHYQTMQLPIRAYHARMPIFEGYNCWQ
eukprot:TRINITY_DN93874_c0_g1_i1.p1 TRINITY_DN93874_c0_g1~~TRINITY_DN93874_c0_g1_i1.p1  ORF type:complete len:358 (-),score=42.79 TRINITY_DN93874_c0_g1_i1:221-1135(-)